MKNMVNLTVAATLATAVAAHSHQHARFHAKKNEASPVEKRAPDAVVEYVAGPTKTEYLLDGKLLDANKAKAGLDNGIYVSVNETTPTFVPPPPPPKPTTTTKNLGAQFVEKSSSKAPPPPPETTTTTAPPVSPKQTDKSQSSAQGLDKDFADGELSCDTFPSDYGALALKYLELGGYTCIQNAPGYTLGSLKAISYLANEAEGGRCKKNSFCDYNCPPGYQKTQMPEAQGSSGQSVGGLWCGPDGKLHLSNKSKTKLCEKGVGGVSVKNDLKKLVSTCRTAYPACEAMVYPAVAEAGGTVELATPDQNYYKWKGAKTTAQWYVNPAGVGPEVGCRWGSAGNPNVANWAAVNLGTGFDGNMKWLSIFFNKPTNPNPHLGFNIEITGKDVSAKCSFVDGQFSGSDPNGCTVSVPKDGDAVFRYF